MKKITFFLLIAVLLASCGTSQSAIETAIAQTAAAIPTTTLTPEPTATPVPTATVIPSPPILDSFVTNADFGTLSKYYEDMPLTVKSLINVDYALQEYCGLYLSKTEIGLIVICLYEFKDTPLAKSVASLQKKEYLKTGEIITIPSTSKVQIPDNFWAIDAGDNIFTGCSHNNVVIITMTALDKSKIDVQVSLVIPLLITTNQINRLISAGF